MSPFRPLPYLLAGVPFGLVLTKTEAISWFRIQEMFHFQSFHMYGLITSAIVVGAVSLFIIRRIGMKSAQGEKIAVAPKKLGTGRRYLIGGAVFGLGWSLAGACPGPMFALIGGGVTVVAVVLLSATLGTRVYSAIYLRLPH